nr:VWA domain-containing protein [Nocardioides perillae]
MLVVLDRTTSMAATDGPGGRTRLEAARADLAVLTERLEGARFGLVVWGREVEEVVPATTDRAAFLDAVARTAPEDPRAGTGSTVDRPLPEVTALLRRAARQYPERGSLVLLLSDGEDTTGRPAGTAARSWRPAGALSDGGAVLGYGTRAGATMPRADLPGAPPVVDPRSGAPALSRADPATLRRVASQLEVPYVGRGPSAGPAALRDLALRLPEPEAVVTRAVPTPTDPAWALAGLAALLGLAELRRWARDLHETRRAGRP